MKKNEFIEYLVLDLLAPLGTISAKAMFGGYGIYKDAIIFGIVISGELYLKVDDTNRFEYEKIESEPFVYEGKDGKKSSMSYWKIPPEILEDAPELLRLCEISYDISLANRLVTKKKPK